jgi:hypothetical protein
VNCFQEAGCSNVIHAGAISPYVLRFDITSEDPEINLDLATSAKYEILRQNGVRETWTASIDPTDRTPTFIRIARPLEATDVPNIDEIMISPVLVTASGEIRAEPCSLKVVSPFDPELAS